jgi:hypothetical protein
MLEKLLKLCTITVLLAKTGEETIRLKNKIKIFFITFSLLIDIVYLKMA